MGKTALLMELADRAADVGFVVARVSAGDTMLDEILELIQISGAKHVSPGRGLKGFSASALGFSVGLTFADEVRRNYGFRVKLSLLCDALAKAQRGVLLLVDEVTATSPPIRQLATAFQQLRGDGKNIALAMAGLPGAVSAVLNDDVLTFLNRAHQVHLGPISLTDVTAFYAQAFTRLGKTYSADVLRLAVAATRGYPYLLQLVGYHVLRVLGDAPEMTATAVALAAGNARRDLADTVYAPALRGLSETDKRFLAAMAVDSGPSRVRDIRQRTGMTKANAQQYRARLIAAGLITPSARGEVEFVLPYLNDYLNPPSWPELEAASSG
jgi:DNA-binding MarR family transcriptional regulator